MHADDLLGPELQQRICIDPRWEIVEYLCAHPGAADTFDGIVDWWLPRQRYEMARSAIKAALQDLVQRGIVEELTIDSDSRLYRLAAPSVKQ